MSINKCLMIFMLQVAIQVTLIGAIAAAQWTAISFTLTQLETMKTLFELS